jgi:hypothetical protein
MKPEELTVEDYTELIRVGVPFAQANYGDGEWACILGKQGQNVNGEVYHPLLGSLLRNTLFQPYQWCGMNPGRRLGPEVDAFLQRNPVDVRWVWKETLSAANVKGDLAPFFRALRGRKTLLVGPPHLQALPPEVIEHDGFIEIPPSNAWESWAEIVRLVEVKSGLGTVVLFCAGMASNLMINNLARRLSWLTLLDMGAIFDPYVGHYTRKHYRRPQWKAEARERNLA